MVILYDGYIFEIQRTGGINRYFSNLIQRLPPDVTPLLTAPEQREHCFPSNPRLRLYCPPKDVCGLGKLTRLVKGVYLEAVERSHRVDVAHPTYHVLFSGRAISKYRSPVVVTIHDMISERYGLRFDPSGREVSAKKAAVEAADAIICVSEHTKSDLMERLHVPEERITVIPNASELSAEMADHEASTVSAPYVLFVGSRAFYKNFARTVLAFGKAATMWPELRLVVVGSPITQIEEEWLSALRLRERVIEKVDIGDRQLAALYRGSEALIYPSLYEGFGIPLLEAMSCGTIPIAARTSSIPEVVGDAAILFDPYSVDELTECILSLRQLGGRREEYLRKGQQRTANYSWDSTATKTLELYRQLAG